MDDNNSGFFFHSKNEVFARIFLKMMTLLYVKKSGTAIPMALAAVMILLALGASLLTLGVNARLFSARDSEEISARCAADAGITKALFDMNAKLQVTPWNDSYLPSESDVPLSGTNAYYSYNVLTDGSNYVVTATGTCGNTQKQIRCTLSLAGPFEAAVFCESYVWFHNNCVIDQYNADEGTPSMKVGTNSVEQWQLCLYSDAVINGDAIVGAGGDPDITIDNKGIITGSQYAMSTPQKLESVKVPSSLADLPSQGTLKEGDVTVSGKYDKIDLGNNATVTIKGDVTLYVTGDVTLGNSARIIVDSESNASLTLYLSGDFSGNNSSNINNQTQNPHNAEIYGLDSCTKINMKNDSSFYGTIYAPQADVVYNNSAALYGSVIAKSFETKNSSPIHYDASLRDVSAEEPLVRFRITNWTEIN